MSKACNYALDNLITHLEKAWYPLLDYDVTADNEFNGPTPYPVSLFLEQEYVARSLLGLGRKFLDVGCGIGTKLLLMDYIGWSVTGLERIPEFAETASKMCPDADVLTIDAFDYLGYADHDFIYTYKPIRDNEKMAELLDFIVDGAKKGALFFLPMCHVPDSLTNLGIQNIYVK